MTFANRSRIEQTVEALAQFNATPGAGITRLSYTAEYRAAQAYLKQELEAAGLSVRLDPMGNLIGRKEGTDRSLAAIAVGSHLDSVRAFLILDCTTKYSITAPATPTARSRRPSPGA